MRIIRVIEKILKSILLFIQYWMTNLVPPFVLLCLLKKKGARDGERDRVGGNGVLIELKDRSIYDLIPPYPGR